MKPKQHIICLIKKNKELLDAIEMYCKGLPVENSKDLNEKAYWFLHKLNVYPSCKYDKCNEKVKFHGLRNGYATACCTSHAAFVAWPKIAKTNIT